MRMHMGADWRPTPVPPLLWLNTGVLIASSVALHRAQVAARRDNMNGVRQALLAGGVLTSPSWRDSSMAWRQLDAAGYFLASNPANSFFYLLTAVHGLHVLGGLVALARAAARVWSGEDADRVRLSVELCAIYWHFLLFVWLVLFALLLHHSRDGEQMAQPASAQTAAASPARTGLQGSSPTGRPTSARSRTCPGGRP